MIRRLFGAGLIYGISLALCMALPQAMDAAYMQSSDIYAGQLTPMPTPIATPIPTPAATATATATVTATSSGAAMDAKYGHAIDMADSGLPRLFQSEATEWNACGVDYLALIGEEIALQDGSKVVCEADSRKMLELTDGAWDFAYAADGSSPGVCHLTMRAGWNAGW